jgi:predicted porin
MHKSLLIVALFSLCSTSLAQSNPLSNAQSNTAMYAILDAGIAYDNGNSAGSVTAIKSGQESSSRLGFKGNEDLGDNMKALFVLEEGIVLNTGVSDQGGRLFGRQAYVGLGGDFGTVTVGRQYTPIYLAYGAIDPFGNNSAGDINTLFGADYNFIGNHKRIDNAMVYTSAPNSMGINASVAYSFGGQTGDTSALSQAGLSLGYTSSAMKIIYAYHEANEDKPPVNGDTYKSHFLGATYDFAPVKTHIAFDQTMQGDGFKTQSYLLGATIPFGKHALFGDYTFRENKVTADAHTNQLAMGYNYSLSKRVNLYTIFSYLKNDANSKVKTDELGSNVTTVQAGIRYAF